MSHDDTHSESLSPAERAGKYGQPMQRGRANHEEQINELRASAALCRSRLRLGGNDEYWELIAVAMEASAALLETHDATGISLDDWNGPAQLVSWSLARLSLSDFMQNEV